MKLAEADVAVGARLHVLLHLVFLDDVEEAETSDASKSDEEDDSRAHAFFGRHRNAHDESPRERGKDPNAL